MFHWLRRLTRFFWREYRYYQHDSYVPIRTEWFTREDEEGS